MPKGLSRPILALASYFDQFYSLFFGLVDNQAKKQYFKDKIVRWLQLGKLLPLELHRNFTQERFKWDCLHTFGNKSDVAINVAFMQIVMCMLVPRPQFLETYSGKFRSGVTLPGHVPRTTRTNLTAGRDNEKRFIKQDI